MEVRPHADDITALLDAALAAPQGASIGITGPPGVGKSTLIDAMIRHWRARGTTVAVIAVDPSSRRTGGALLGDRTRFTTDPADQGVFVRSMAARDRLGGIAALTFPAMVLMRALFDRVIVETVGVGQSETEIAKLCDQVVFCAQPGSGDALQFMKAGVMEIPDIVLVTKADMGAPARRAVADLKGALGLATSAGEPIPDVLSCAAAQDQGVETFLDLIGQRLQAVASDRENRHQAQARAWQESQVIARFGQAGHAAALRGGRFSTGDSPFREIAELSNRLEAVLDAAFR